MIVRQRWQYVLVPSLSDLPATTYKARGGFNHSESNLVECFQIIQVSMMAQEICTCGVRTQHKEPEIEQNYTQDSRQLNGLQEV